jgi:hypothetical protein
VSLHSRQFLMNFPRSERLDIQEESTRLQRRTWLSIPTVLLGFFCLCFLMGAIRVASRNYLWMDEVLAVWTARLPTVQAVWAALFQGAEASPPTYHLFLHGLMKAGAESYGLLRLPSILGALAAGLCVFALLRKYLDTAAAGFGIAFSLLGVLAWYGVEARPYTLVTACFAAAILLWDGADSERPKIWRIAAISGLLILAICLHFYAVLLIPCMAAMEVLWSMLNRRVRVSIWIALFVAGASLVAWLPLIRADRRFIAGEVGSGSFYARPTLTRLLQSYADLTVHDKKQCLFIAAALVAIFAAAAVDRIRTSGKQDREAVVPYATGTNLYIIGFCTLAFPLIVFVFSLFVTSTFNTRYALIGSFGVSLLAAYTISRLRISSAAVYAIVLVACPLAFIRGAMPEAVHIPDQLAVLNKASIPRYSIVIPDARVYFELAEAAPPNLKSRLAYVDLPPGVKNGDPTNEHHVDRWHGIRPDLNIVSAKDFFAHNAHFYVFHTTAQIYVLTNWLMERKLIDRPVAEDEDAWLLEARSPGVGHDDNLVNTTK